jgi:hypothetical protein
MSLSIGNLNLYLNLPDAGDLDASACETLASRNGPHSYPSQSILPRGGLIDATDQVARAGCRPRDLLCARRPDNRTNQHGPPE